MASILDQQHRRELESYTAGLLRRIAKKSGIKFEDLVEFAYEYSTSSTSSKNSKNIELEYVSVNSVEYLMNSSTKEIYTFNDNPILIGKLNDYNEPILVKVK